MITKPPLQKILKNTEDEENITMKVWEILNLKRKTDKYSEKSIELAIDIQIHRQKSTKWQESQHISQY
jgi:hypothetical protein